MKTDDWESWQWQLSNSIRNLEDLKKELNLLEEEKIENVSTLPILSLRITPYYLDLIKKNPILRRTVVPTKYEFDVSENESTDPLDEDKYKHGCIVHKHENRCLFLTTIQCASYCRYCTRSRLVGGIKNYIKKDWDDGIKYINEHSEIVDVLFSGGDFFMLSNSNIAYLLNKLNKISHINILRIGTKMPVFLPQRIDNELINILKKYKPFINIHVSHSSEITDEFIEVCNKLSVDANCILGSQTVLLKNINDDTKILQELFNKLLKNRIVPYYLYQMDRITGGEHFRIDLEKMIEIMHQLISWNSGRVIPEFVVDSEIGKVPLRYGYIEKNNNGKYNLTSFEKNKTIEY